MQPVTQRIGVRQSLSRLVTVGLLATAIIVLLFAVLSDADAGTLPFQPQQQRLFLPSVLGPPPPPEVSPAGNYDCHEHEYGLLFGDAYQVHLNEDGTSRYSGWGYDLTGTWTYTPSTHILGLTNYSFITATYYSPTYFYAEFRQAFEVGGSPTHDVYCSRP